MKLSAAARRRRQRREPSDKQPWSGIAELPGFQGIGRHARLRLCSDHDVPKLIVGHLRDQMGINGAFEDGVSSKDDTEIAAWARQRSRVLLTFNHNDFFSDEQSHPLHQCPGIIAIAIPNNGRRVPFCLRMLDVLVAGIARKVPADWWPRTKIRVAHDHFLMRRYADGDRRDYEISILPSGRLQFRELNRS